MALYSGAINPQSICEVLIPFGLKYPYSVIVDGKTVEIKTDLFPDKREEELVDEGQAQEIEIATTYKLRPVVIICDLGKNRYLALAVTKRKDNDSQFLLAVCKNEIKDRHFLPLKNYSDKLKYDSYVLIPSIYLVSRENIQYRRGRLRDEDFQTIQAKLKSIIF